jgi:hypothetical protein
VKLFRRKKRHVHKWTKWQVVGLEGVHLKSGVRAAWDAQQRTCPECGYTQRESL